MNRTEFNNWQAQMVKLTDMQLVQLRKLCDDFLADRAEQRATAHANPRNYGSHEVSRGAW